MNSLQIIRKNGDQTFIRNVTDTVDCEVLAAGVGAVHAIPENASFVIFSANNDFFAKPNGPASINLNTTSDGSASEYMPSSWYIAGLTGIGLVSENDCKVVMSFYSL